MQWILNLFWLKTFLMFFTRIATSRATTLTLALALRYDGNSAPLPQPTIITFAFSTSRISFFKSCIHCVSTLPANPWTMNLVFKFELKSEFLMDFVSLYEMDCLFCLFVGVKRRKLVWIASGEVGNMFPSILKGNPRLKHPTSLKHTDGTSGSCPLQEVMAKMFFKFI